MKKLFAIIFILLSGYLSAQSQYRFFINKINMPINNRGVLGAVNIPPEGTLGRFEESSFLFSGGFWFSGYNADTLWACAQATASLIENFIPGNVDSNQYDPRYDIYVLDNFSNINSEVWNRYKFAANNGADYYDGDNNGIYDPIDHNNNHQWDLDEDRPDILGRQTAWCVYNDGVQERLRFPGVDPVGLEIHQSLFGYSEDSRLRNVLFIRYKIKNSGKVNSILDSVYFTAWADADLGETFDDDLVGSDTLLQSGFIYNQNESDPGYGTTQPAFFISLLQGPQTYIPGETFIDNNSNGVYDKGIDTPLDTAYNNKGEYLGIESFPGAKNLGMTSFVHYQASDPTLGDPDNEFEARNYMKGLRPNGTVINPCTFPLGTVTGGVNCSEVNPFYWYSGDPVTNYGWINNNETDQRMVVNTGPFDLEVGKSVTIIVAYIVGRGTDRLNSITKAREITEFVHQFYQSNFDNSLVSVENENNLITDFKLYQNFPNPFNPNTKISFHIPDFGFVSLKVYDVLGREIETLVNEEKPSGTYEVMFDASSLSSGIYFYELRTEKFSSVMKMIYLK